MVTHLHVSTTEFCINCGCLREVNWCGVWHTILQSSYEGKPLPCQERKTQREFFFPWLETLIKLNVWTGGTQFSKRKKFFGVGLINSGGSSNWRIAALVLGGFWARVIPWAQSNHGKLSPLRRRTAGKPDYSKTWLFAWRGWNRSEIICSGYGLYRAFIKAADKATNTNLA